MYYKTFKNERKITTQANKAAKSRNTQRLENIIFEAVIAQGDGLEIQGKFVNATVEIDEMSALVEVYFYDADGDNEEKHDAWRLVERLDRWLEERRQDQIEWAETMDSLNISER